MSEICHFSYLLLKGNLTGTVKSPGREAKIPALNRPIPKAKNHMHWLYQQSPKLMWKINPMVNGWSENDWMSKIIFLNISKNFMGKNILQWYINNSQISATVSNKARGNSNCQWWGGQDIHWVHRLYIKKAAYFGHTSDSRHKDQRTRGVEIKDIKWEVLKKSPKYVPGGIKCDICLSEKLAIMKDRDPNFLTKCSEISSKSSLMSDVTGVMGARRKGQRQGTR